MVSKIEDREDVIPFETICGNHDYSIKLIKQFKRTCSSTEDTWYLDQAIKLIRYCKRQGQHMEAHMARVRKNIEACGYKRVYKLKKGKTKKSWQEEE